MTRDPPRYLAYLLRVWQVESNGEQSWRVSLESARTGERRGFATLDDLLQYLRLETRGRELVPGKSKGIGGSE